jgi:hypothetical protein
MESETSIPRSRRAILAAAAGAAGALVASAAVPLGVAAHDVDDVALGVDNPTTATTSLTNSAEAGTALAGNSTGAAAVDGSTGFGVEGTSTAGAGVYGWSVQASSVVTSADLPYTGVFGFAPTGASGFVGAGVWGDSPDTGVFGSGSYGVVGYGGVGVEGDANGLAGSIGVRAWAPTTAVYALKVVGKVNFSRSGRVSISSGATYRIVSLAGVTATSKVFAVFATSESGRWIRAVVPASGKFTMYFNAALTSSAVASWFVLD